MAGDGGMEETVQKVDVEKKGGGNGLMIYGYLGCIILCFLFQIISASVSLGHL